MFLNNHRHFSIKFYIGIITSTSLALSICGLFISCMQSVNGAHILNPTAILLFPLPADNATTVIVPPKSIYPSI